jgi:hypothetical protein
MTKIYALKVDDVRTREVYQDCRNGEARFGWSYCETADLRRLRKMIESGQEDQLTDDEWDCYQDFLLDISPGDYVVYINVPSWGRCTAAQVTKGYYWRYDDDDFNHRIGVDLASVFDFDRNDSAVHPNLSARLKLQGRKWRVYAVDEFKALVDVAASGGFGSRATEEDRQRRLCDECQPHLRGITKAIHHTHPGKQLETLLKIIIERLPGVREVTHCQGRADRGADLVALMESAHPITQEVTQTTCVIQVKSFEGQHWDTGAVEDIRRAFKAHPDATEGLIISTASVSTQVLEAKLEDLRRETGRSVKLLIGAEVAVFIIRSGLDVSRQP